MKKLFSTLLITVALLSGQHSQAFSGLVMGHWVFALKGIAVTYASPYVARTVVCGGMCDDTRIWPAINLAILGVVAGVVMVDQKSNKLEFNVLSVEKGLELGLSKVQFDSYNSDVEKLNLVTQEVAAELSDMKKPTDEDAREIYSQYETIFSQQTHQALEIIFNQ